MITLLFQTNILEIYYNFKILLLVLTNNFKKIIMEIIEKLHFIMQWIVMVLIKLFNNY
jgi:hypothetical protein